MLRDDIFVSSIKINFFKRISKYFLIMKRDLIRLFTMKKKCIFCFEKSVFGKINFQRNFEQKKKINQRNLHTNITKTLNKTF